MDLLAKFLRKIDRPTPHALYAPDSIFRALAQINPEKFYVENIRSVLNVSYDKAVDVVNEAVAKGYFAEGVELIAPDGTVAKTLSSPDEISSLPDTIEGWELVEGDYEPVEYRTSQLIQHAYYRLAEVQ